MTDLEDVSPLTLSIWQDLIADQVASGMVRVTVLTITTDYDDCEELSSSPGHPCGDVPVSAKVVKVLDTVRATLGCALQLDDWRFPLARIEAARDWLADEDCLAKVCESAVMDELDADDQKAWRGMRKHWQAKGFLLVPHEEELHLMWTVELEAT